MQTGYFQGFTRGDNVLSANEFNVLSVVNEANRAEVPTATPVPGYGYEPYETPTKKTMKMQPIFSYVYPEPMSYNQVADLFEGVPKNEEYFCGLPYLPLDPLPYDDGNLPDLSVFDLISLLDELDEPEHVVPSSACPPSYGVPSPSSEGSYSSASDENFSPAVCSMDEGFESDSGGSTQESEKCPESPLSSIGSECGSPPRDEEPPAQTVPMKTGVRRKRGPKPPAMYTGTGPIQLWQFIIELLVKTKSPYVQWTYDEPYEFKLLNPSAIAKQWGKRKNKPNMNYEKLSRGLRYYYDKNIIEKVHGKRYVYLFVCDIPKILGYDPMEQKQDVTVEDAVCGEPEGFVSDLFCSQDPASVSGSLVDDFMHSAMFA